MKTENRIHFIDIQTHFLCCVPIKKIQWKENINNLSWDEQKLLLNETVSLPQIQQYPLDRNYVIRFLRHVIDLLEKQSLEVHDDFYTILCDYQSKYNEECEFSFKHYQIFDDEKTNIAAIVLKENRNKISQGTTGLNVWESALAISDWAIQNKHFFRGKHVLELGAGTGLSSLIIGKCCSPKKIQITDGNENVIKNLVENVSNNFEKSDDNLYHYRDGQTSIGVLNLDWSQNNEKYIETQLADTDVIIAADIIYDNSLFDSLLSTLRMLFDHCKNCNKFMLVNAVRNPETEQEFLTKLAAFGFQYQEEPTIQSKYLYWEPNPFSPIKLYSIFNQQISSDS